jgi:hypothetical protein
MTMIVACVRMDIVAGMYMLLLLALLFVPNRRLLASVWPVFVLILVIAVPVQYASAVGLPPSLCWRKWKRAFAADHR